MEEGKREGDGVKRTHREPRSHDLMNELAWLLATWWGGYSPSSLLAPSPTSSTTLSLSSILSAQGRKPRDLDPVVGVVSRWIYVAGGKELNRVNRGKGCATPFGGNSIFRSRSNRLNTRKGGFGIKLIIDKLDRGSWWNLVKED